MRPNLAYLGISFPSPTSLSVTAEMLWLAQGRRLSFQFAANAGDTNQFNGTCEARLLSVADRGSRAREPTPVASPFSPRSMPTAARDSRGCFGLRYGTREPPVNSRQKVELCSEHQLLHRRDTAAAAGIICRRVPCACRSRDAHHAGCRCHPCKQSPQPRHRLPDPATSGR
jgi:hypothetical protein